MEQKAIQVDVLPSTDRKKISILFQATEAIPVQALIEALDLFSAQLKQQFPKKSPLSL